MLAVAIALLGVAPAVHAVAGGAGALPIPQQLTADWTAPSGTFTAPAASVTVAMPVTVDLSAATITGTTGYLFQLLPGGELTVQGGVITGPLTGLVLDSVGSAGAGRVTVDGTQLTNVRSIVFAAAPSGPIDVSLTNVSAVGLGDGVRATVDALDVQNSTLEGGGIAPLGSPAGLHSFDDPALHVAVPASHINVFGSTITGFRSAKFQGDSIIGETRVATADIENCVLGHNSDTGGLDSKIGTVTFKNNIVYSDGYRAVASHYGTVYSSSNTIYQAASGGKKHNVGIAYQGSGVLVATGDTVALTPGAYLAQSDIVLTGSAALITYPRIGNLTLTHILGADGAALTGPKRMTILNGIHSIVTITL
jgi:hypothetical protein